MASSRQLKTKIRSVGNIKKITRAMQMVAATKMRKSQEAALSARPYAKKSLALLSHLLQYSTAEGIKSKYWRNGADSPPTGGGKVALVVVTSDKGLAGSFNSGVLRAAAKWKAEQEDPPAGGVDIVAVGKKGRDFFKARGEEIAAEFFQLSDTLTLANITPLMEWIIGAYDKGEYDKVVFCSTQFVSALVQKPEINQILPLEREELKKIVGGIVPKTGLYSELAEENNNNGAMQYLLEPSAKDIMEKVVRSLVQVAIMHLLYESNASEHSARMMAMKNATENAEGMMEALNLELNKSRQASITQELTEIATAKEALTSD
jgi:F-type H+-transporting ATPase subunit gamma